MVPRFGAPGAACHSPPIAFPTPPKPPLVPPLVICTPGKRLWSRAISLLLPPPPKTSVVRWGFPPIATPPINPVFGFPPPPITPCTGKEFPFKEAMGGCGAGAEPAQRMDDSRRDPDPVGRLMPSMDANAELPDP
jgi:hypothetical protein